MCGENPKKGIKVPWERGSSPRVRGKRLRCAAKPSVSGLIPACAGKTGRRPQAHERFWAHPRVCGENCCQGGYPFSRPGSSPRVRGKHRAPRGGARFLGLIPACAGKTIRDHWPRARPPAHPRVCGENDGSKSGDGRWVGSSPRVRGKHCCWVEGWRGVGLIPACAGKTRGRGWG